MIFLHDVGRPQCTYIHIYIGGLRFAFQNSKLKMPPCSQNAPMCHVCYMAVAAVFDARTGRSQTVYIPVYMSTTYSNTIRLSLWAWRCAPPYLHRAARHECQVPHRTLLGRRPPQQFSTRRFRSLQDPLCSGAYQNCTHMYIYILLLYRYLRVIRQHRYDSSILPVWTAVYTPGIIYFVYVKKYVHTSFQCRSMGVLYCVRNAAINSMRVPDRC